MMPPPLYHKFWYLLTFSIYLNVLQMSVIKDVKGVDKRSMVAAERPDIFGAGSWCIERKKEIDLKCTRQCK